MWHHVIECHACLFAEMCCCHSFPPAVFLQAAARSHAARQAELDAREAAVQAAQQQVEQQAQQMQVRGVDCVCIQLCRFFCWLQRLEPDAQQSVPHQDPNAAGSSACVKAVLGHQHANRQPGQLTL